MLDFWRRTVFAELRQRSRVGRPSDDARCLQCLRCCCSTDDRLTIEISSHDASSCSAPWHTGTVFLVHGRPCYREPDMHMTCVRILLLFAFLRIYDLRLAASQSTAPLADHAVCTVHADMLRRSVHRAAGSISSPSTGCMHSLLTDDPAPET